MINTNNVAKLTFTVMGFILGSNSNITFLPVAEASLCRRRVVRGKPLQRKSFFPILHLTADLDIQASKKHMFEQTNHGELCSLVGS